MALNTHFNIYGARVMASAILDAITGVVPDLHIYQKYPEVTE